MIINDITLEPAGLPVYNVYRRGAVIGQAAIQKIEKKAVVCLPNTADMRLALPGILQQTCYFYEPEAIIIDTVADFEDVFTKTAEGLYVFPVEDFEKIAAIDKTKMVEAYTLWRKTPTKRNMAGVVRSLRPVVNRELHTYRGTLAEPVLKGLAKKVAIAAVKNFDPNRGTALSTHMVHQMQQLHRKNYESFGTVRLPEHLQRGVGGFLRAQDYLKDKLGRIPTTDEIADEMGWNTHQVTQINKRLRNEISDSALEFDPVYSADSPYDTKVDFFYHDLPTPDKIIFEHTTGYGGKQHLKKNQIAKQLGLSPARVTQRATSIANKFKRALHGKL